jgi:hypothetical protein
MHTTEDELQIPKINDDGETKKKPRTKNMKKQGNKDGMGSHRPNTMTA